jgi:type II secretory pathway pseudopilin PulG
MCEASLLKQQGGFTYLGLLLGIVLLGIGLTATSEVWFTTAQRQRQVQSQWAAQQYLRAIGSYYESGPGGVKSFPKSVDDLLEDRRGAVLRRHLRQIYVNPETGNREWSWIAAPGGGLMGVQVSAWKASGDLPGARELVYRPVTP